MMYPGDDNKMHVRTTLRNGDKTEEEEESFDAGD